LVDDILNGDEGKKIRRMRGKRKKPVYIPSMASEKRSGHDPELLVEVKFPRV